MVSKIEKMREKLVGKSFTTNSYGECTVIAYEGKRSVLVEFNHPYCVVKCRSDNLLRGKVANPMLPTFYEKGYMGVGNYSSRDKRHYRLWTDMLERGYSMLCKDKQPSYRNTTVCDEWLNFQNFAKWCDRQDSFNKKDCKGKSYQLDKDILVKGNKIYSPETCRFVPQEINKLLTNRRNDRGLYPIGVTYEKDRCRFTAQMLCYGKHKRLGSFETPEEAFQAYKTAKESYIKEVAEKWKDSVDDEVYNALMNWEIRIDD